MINLLVLGDSPYKQTGFARLIQNLLIRLRPHFDNIDVWGIGESGYPRYDIVRENDAYKADVSKYPYRVFPGGNQNWSSPEKLSQFLNVLATEKSGKAFYTHVLFIHDLFMLSHSGFPDQVERICTDLNIKSVYYVPVDSELDKDWVDILRPMDHVVAYTHFGKNEIAKHYDGEVSVIPHGVDTDIYKPLPEMRARRKEFLKGAVEDDEILLLNVNSNTRRKGIIQSLQIIKELQTRSTPKKFKLMLHMSELDEVARIDLSKVAQQLGIQPGTVIINGNFFQRGHAMATEVGLNQIYNCADAVISTSLGEGFGFSLVEGAAAGLPVFAPNHTSCLEIKNELNMRGVNPGFGLPLSTEAVVHMMDNSRVRYPVNTSVSAFLIASYFEAIGEKRIVLNHACKQWLSWDRIAGCFLNTLLS